jgi:glycerol uptake facilitator-like aquaporin
VGIALIVMGVPAQDLWLYLVGPLAGGAMAALLFKMQNPVVEGELA